MKTQMISDMVFSSTDILQFCLECNGHCQYNTPVFMCLCKTLADLFKTLCESW